MFTSRLTSHVLHPARSCAVVFVGIALMNALTFNCSAASKFWDGSSDGNLATAANWVGGVAPVAGDELVFQTGVARLLVTNNFSPNRAFNSLLFQGSNYFLRGNPILVTNGISSVNSVGTNHVDADVDVRASQAWEAQGALASLDINGDISLNANTLTVRAGTGDFFFSGIISGTGNLVKTNVGTLRLDGTGTNTYSGFTRLDGGVLELAKSGLAVPGSLIVGDGNNFLLTDVLRLLADNQIADTSPVTIKNSGLFNLDGFDDRIGALTMQGGTIDSGAGTLILGGNVNTLLDDNTAFIEGRLSLGGNSRAFDISPGPPAADMRINATIISGTLDLFSTAGITKNGDGSLFVAGTNTYNGSTIVNDGQLAALSDRALGTIETPLGLPAGTTINGDGNLFLSGVQVTNENLTINSTNAGGAFNASGSSVWTGNILLNASTSIGSSGALLLSGEISGAGGFTKISSGTITLAGTNVNTYTGTTTVRDGTLVLNKDTTSPNDEAMSGPLVIGEDETPEDTDVVRFLACCQLPTDTDITINASGLLDLNGFGQNVSDIVLNGGDIDAPSPGSILPTGNITVNRNTNSQAVVSGRMSVSSNPIIDVTGHFFSPDLGITAALFGTGGFTKNGVGEVSLNAASTYSGLTIVNAGFLLVNDSSALGTTASGTVVNTGAVLSLNFGVAVPTESLTLAGTGQASFGALHSGFGSNSWAGDINLTGNATVTVAPGSFLNLGGGISGAFDIVQTNTGTLIFSGATGNSFDDMFVHAGTLLLNKTIVGGAFGGDLSVGTGVGPDTVRLLNDNQVPDNSRVHILSSGLFELNDNNETCGTIDGGGVINLGSGTLRAGTDDESALFAGAIIGTGSLFKLGSGAWTLTANNSYSGLTTVSAGALVVNGLQPQSPVSVNGTATLMGSGTVGNLQVFGALRPGGSAGILTSSNVSFAAQADYFVELGGPSPGSGYDRLNVRGTNQLGGSTLHVSLLPGFAPVEGDQFTILNNDGSDAIQGTFAGLPNNSIFTVGGLNFHIRYSDAFGNDVVLMVTNTALELSEEVFVETGNGNSDIEPGECNLLNIRLANKFGFAVSGVTATLSCTNPGVTITQPTSSYPNFPANGTSTNSSPFQISTAPSLVCGTNIDLLLTIQTATNGSFTIPIVMYTGSSGTNGGRFNRTGDQAIPDLGTLNSTINVAGLTTPIHHLQVSLHLTHTADADLDISLIGPDGTTIILSSDNGGSLDDYGTSCSDADRTTFFDSVGTQISLASAPFRGFFRPEQPLSTFRGKYGASVNGTWTLRVADDTASGLGTLRCWSIIVFGTDCQPGGGECEVCPGCLVRLNIARDPSANSRVLLKWSTAFPDYNLVSTNALINGGSAFSPFGGEPIVVNGKFTVTNNAVGTNRFYELRKP